MNDEALIKLLNASDKKAFEQLYDKYVGMVYGFLRSLLKNNAIDKEHFEENVLRLCMVIAD